MEVIDCTCDIENTAVGDCRCAVGMPITSQVRMVVRRRPSSELTVSMMSSTRRGEKDMTREGVGKEGLIFLPFSTSDSLSTLPLSTLH